MTSRQKYITLSAVAAVASLAAIGAAFSLARSGDDGSAVTTTVNAANAAGGPASAASDPELCRLKVTGAVLTLDNAFLSKLSDRDVRVEAVAPAVTSNSRQIELKTRVSVDVSCDTTTGVIGLRGGMRLQGSDATVDIRRWRIAARNGVLAAYFRARDKAPIKAFRLALRDSARSGRGKVETIAAPLEMADGGVAAINHAFGTEFRSGRSLVGTLTLTAERIEQA